MTSPIFDYNDYKAYLKDVLESSRGMQSRLARYLGCQASYLYQTLKGKAELTEDQSFKATQFLNFSELERDYFLNLVRLSKASSPDLKAFLKTEIARLKKEDLNLKNKSDAPLAEEDHKVWEFYFSGVLPSLIHFMTSSAKFQTSSAIASKLKISENKALEHLKQLAKYGFVNQSQKKWVFASTSLHLPKESKHNLVLQILRRTQATNSILNGDPDAIHYSSLFTLDRESFEQLRQQVSRFVEKSQKTIHSGGSDDVYVLCLDLFDPLLGS